jgi:hypothetical protein
MIPKLRNIRGFFSLILVVSSFTDVGKTMPIFTAKFYDEAGVFIGTFGETNADSPIYIAASEVLFPAEFANSDFKMTTQSIISKVGTEIIYDRFQPIVELNTHIGICKLPPKKHRDEMRQIIESTHLDANNAHKIDEVEYEIGGCGYHNNAGELLHLRAIDGKPMGKDRYPSIEVFNAIDFYTKVDSNQQLFSENGVKLISERRVEYTWHTHPPKINPRKFQQSPSYQDYLFGNNYQYIKQHFMISLKYKFVYYYESPKRLGVPIENFKAYNFKLNYDTFFDLE